VCLRWMRMLSSWEAQTLDGYRVGLGKQVNERHPLTRYHLQKIISARQDILLNPDPPATLHDLEIFSMATQYRLLRLQVRFASCRVARCKMFTFCGFRSCSQLLNDDFYPCMQMKHTYPITHEKLGGKQFVELPVGQNSMYQIQATSARWRHL
jgi:hypothetical protein